MRRDRATNLLDEMLHRLDAGQGEWPVSLINEVHVFGSFTRGAPEPHDVDVEVEFDAGDRRFFDHSMSALVNGFDNCLILRQGLVGRRRGCQFQFNQLDRMTASGLDFAMTLLWRRGDRLHQALDRLHAITVDPSAGRAGRDWMLPEFEGLDQWIPGPIRRVLHDAVHAGALTVERLDLEDGVVADAEALDHLRLNWKPGGDLHRAAAAVVAHFEARGVAPSRIRVQRWDFGPGDKLYFAGFQWRYFSQIKFSLADDGGVEWLEVVRLPRSGPLPTLRLRPADRQALAAIRWESD